MKLLKRILIYSSILGAIFYAQNSLKVNKKECRVERKVGSLENLVKEPLEAFVFTNTKIKFVSGDKEVANNCKQGEVWLSMADSYSIGEGDCMEGAISFAGLVKDAKVVWLKNKRGHAISVYKLNDKYGCVSFNVIINSKRGSEFVSARFESFEDAVKFCGKGFNE